MNKQLKWIFVILFLPLLKMNSLLGGDIQNPQNWHHLDMGAWLETAPILENQDMGEFLKAQDKGANFQSCVRLITFENDIRGVFKADDLDDAKMEVAAYRASIVLGFPYIPPTVLREIDGKQGSLQLYIKTPIDLLSPGEYPKFLKTVDEKMKEDLKLFHFVFGQ